MSAIYPHSYLKAIERWLARPFSAESFAVVVGSRAGMVAAVIGLSFSVQIAISAIIFAFTGQQTLAHHVLGQYSAARQFFGGAILAPLIETLLIQATGIFIFRRLLRANWIVSWVAVGCVFGALHGYGGSALVKLSITGILLTAIYVIEKRKEGKPTLMTFATHSIYNTILWVARH
jgi:Type II CAAX prenyl endopeptidase Rce1-like